MDHLQSQIVFTGMAPEVADAVTPPPPRVASAQFNLPSFELLETRDARRRYLNLCVRLKKYAQKGNWIEAKHILSRDNKLINAAIAQGWRTVLHVAAGANHVAAGADHVHFVDELLKLMSDSDMLLQDIKGNTAFCFAAASGNMEIVKLLLDKNHMLAKIRGVDGMTPLQLAALQGRSEMTRFLYDHTTQIFEDKDWNLLFFTCINTGIYDLAWKILEGRNELAFARDEYDETALHILAGMPSEFGCQTLEHQNENTVKMNSSEKKIWVIKLVNSLWGKIIEVGSSIDEIRAIINHPSQLLFEATIVGNYEFVAALIRAYPDLIWEIDSRHRTIIHIAVLHRHANIFNLIHEIGSDKNIIVTYVDSADENTLLHMAAKLAPTDQLNMVSGAAFQMSLELQWFEEVKKVVLPNFIKTKNAERITAHKLFTAEHEKLLEKAEAWMKNTANSCMVVSTLITTGVFSAAFSIPGGTNDDTGNPNYLNKTAFVIFAISDSIALISSSTSILIFVSILISRYAEYDFYKRLPFKLIFGLIALFISITSMMVTFSTSFFITYYHGFKWIPSFISILAILPIILFVYLQFPLWSDILYSTYYCRSLFKPIRDML